MMACDEYTDPLGRGSKGLPPISSQAPPPPPRVNATAFQPSLENRPMFPDASFDGGSVMGRLPLRVSHPVLQSQQQQQQPVTAQNQWDESIPPSPMQIYMDRSKHSSESQRSSTESVRQQHQCQERRQPTNEVRGSSPKDGNKMNDREERESPSPPKYGPYQQHYQQLSKQYEGRQDNDHMSSHYAMPPRGSSEPLPFRSGYDDESRNNYDTRSAGHYQSSQKYHDGNTHYYYHRRDEYDQSAGCRQHEYCLRGYDQRDQLQYFDSNRLHRESNYDVRHQVHNTNAPLSPLSLPTFNDVWSPQSDHATTNLYDYHLRGADVDPPLENYTPSGRGLYDESHRYSMQTRGERYNNEKVHSYSGGQFHPQPSPDRYYHEKHYDPMERYTDVRSVPKQVVYPVPGELPHDQRNYDPSLDKRDDESISSIHSLSSYTTSRRQAPPPPLYHSRQHEYDYDRSQKLRVEVPVSPDMPLPNARHSTRSRGSSASYHRCPQHYQQRYQQHSVGGVYSSAEYNEGRTSRRGPPPSQNEPSHKSSRSIRAEGERKQSEARHQILKEIHQATNMRNTALDDTEKKFWEMQIATLNDSFKKL
jgi:hypothetical protein